MEAAESGVEVRKLHILYFLCRKGHIEDAQGHLITRAHHISRNGIRLRDVKRWLAELRGNDMPDSFAWAYKRKHMKGYVWQDLEDDDLITPEPNNEYVLKGSEISSLTSTQDTKQTQRTSTSEIEEVLPESTLPDDFVKVEEEKSWDTNQQEIFKDNNKVGENHLSSYLINIFNKKAKKMNPSAITMENAKQISTSTDTSSSPKKKSHANVKMFRNFITCRTTETNDYLDVPSVDRSKKFSLKNYSNEAKNPIQTEARSDVQYRKGIKGILKGLSEAATFPANNALPESIYGHSVYAYLMSH